MVTNDLSITCRKCNNRIDIYFKESCNFKCSECKELYFMAVYNDIIRIRQWIHENMEDLLVFRRTYLKW